MNSLRLKLLDLSVITVALLLGGAGFWYNLSQGSASEQKYAAVFLDNRLVAELSLSESDSFTYSFPFGSERQYTAYLEVDSGRIRMLPMSGELCPRGICSHTGWIAYSYESIVCLPNRIMVVFTSSPRDGQELDGVTF